MAKPNYVTEIQFYLTEKKGNGPEGRGKIVVGDAMFVNFTVWSGNDGGFQVQFPRSDNPRFDDTQNVSKENRRYFDEVGCISGEARAEITEFIVDSLLAQREGGNTTGTRDQVEAVIPF